MADTPRSVLKPSGSSALPSSSQKPNNDPHVLARLVSNDEAMDLESRRFRDALGCYPTGVAIITAPDGQGGHVGVTANSFASLSLDPPLVLWSLDKKAYSRDAFHSAGYFGINVLAADQVQLSRHFSKRHMDKFASVEVELGEGGVALIGGCVARFECRTHRTYEGGDHIIFVGEVVAYEYDKTLSPLAFTGGSYAQTAPHIHESPDGEGDSDRE